MMKRIFFAVSILFAMSVHAQTEQGSVMIGGGLSLQTGEASSQFQLNPNIGFFVANNFALGGSGNFFNTKRGNTKSTEFGIGPFARFYFGSTATKPFIVSEFNFLSSSTTQQVGSIETKIKNSGTGFLFGMGFAAFINETVAVEGISGYNYSKFKDADGSGGFALRFGFQLYLNNSSMGNLKTNVLGQ